MFDFKQQDPAFKDDSRASINKVLKGYELTNDLTSNDSLVRINFNKQLNQKGWDMLSISSFSTGNIGEQAFFAGYLEGKATFPEVKQFWTNFKKNNFDLAPEVYDKIKAFFKKVVVELEKKLNSISGTGTKEQRDLIIGYGQLNGLLTGLKEKGEIDMDFVDLLIMQGDGEIQELSSALLNRNF